jgi:hypothetical protein
MTSQWVEGNATYSGGGGEVMYLIWVVFRV